MKEYLVKLKMLIGAAAIAALPLAAEAVMISGQLDITGIVNVQNSSFVPGGFLDFEGDGTVVIATDDFSGLFGATATLFDLDFVAPEDVYTVGGFTFEATSFFDFDSAIPGRAFSASGVITGNGFDATPGLLRLSTQSTSPTQLIASFSSTTTATPIPLPASVLMLMAALGGLGVVSRRRMATA